MLTTLIQYLNVKLLNSSSQEPLAFECKLESILPNSSADIYILKESYFGSDMLKSLPKGEKNGSIYTKKQTSLKSSCHSASTSLLEEAAISFWNSLILSVTMVSSERYLYEILLRKHLYWKLLETPLAWLYVLSVIVI